MKRVREIQRRFWKTSEKYILERVHCQSANVQWAQELIFEDSRQSIRKWSTAIGVRGKTIPGIIKEYLRDKPYTIKVRQMLSEATRRKRVERCNLILWFLERNNADGRLRFFPNEKIFQSKGWSPTRSHSCKSEITGGCSRGISLAKREMARKKCIHVLWKT